MQFIKNFSGAFNIDRIGSYCAIYYPRNHDLAGIYIAFNRYVFSDDHFLADKNISFKFIPEFADLNNEASQSPKSGQLH